MKLGADIVSVLHIAPSHNIDFRKVTSPELENLGESAVDVWKKLNKTEGRFISVNTEQVFGNLSTEQLPELKTYIDYIYDRYSWVQGNKNLTEIGYIISKEYYSKIDDASIKK